MFKITRDGFFFRAINTATGARSSIFTSASQAGLHIERAVGRAQGRKAGQAAHRAAYEDFIAAAHRA